MSTGWSLEGTDLRTLAYEIVDANAWDGYPGKRSGNVEIPYMDGEHSDPRKWYGPRVLPLKVEFFQTNAAGAVTLPGGGEDHLRQNIDTFLGLLHKRDGLLDLRKTVPDLAGGSQVRQAMVEVVDFIPLEEDRKMLRQAVVQFRIVESFWRELAQNTETEAGVTTASHNFDVITGGNAPIRGGLAGAFVVEFTANAAIDSPKIANLTTGEFIQYSGGLVLNDVLTIDIGQKTAVLNGTLSKMGSITRQHAWWLELDPAVTTQLTASVGVASDFDVDVKWYDRWL